MAELTHVPKLVLKWVLSCKAPKTSKDVAKHFYIEEATARYYLRLLTVKNLLKIHYQKKQIKYYGTPLSFDPKPEPMAIKPPKKKKPASLALPNVANPSKLEDVWGRVVQG